MNDLTNKQCIPCANGGQPMDGEQAIALMSQLSDWTLDDDSKIISRDFRFKNYYQTMAFVNAVAWIAHQQDHHPTLVVDYNRCRVSYTTHAVKGLSENDFICAAKTDVLVKL